MDIKNVSNNKGLSFKIAYSGIICAISTIILFISIVPGFTYALPAVSGLIIWTIAEQINKKWGLLSYATTCSLSLMLIPEPEAIAFFISFFGYYPIVRESLLRFNSIFIRLIIKLALFNVSVVLTFQIVSRIIGIDKMLEGLEFMGNMAVYGLWIIANLAFLCYDFCIVQFFYIYRKLLMPKLIRRIK